jgi:hypothetical protein
MQAAAAHKLPQKLFVKFQMITASKFAQIDERLRSRDDVRALAMADESVTYNTAVSVYGQKYQRLTKKNLPIHRKPEQMQAYYRRCARVLNEHTASSLTIYAGVL